MIRVELETTAAEAQIQAPTATIAREVEVNAEHAHDAFNAAAEAAKSKGPALTGSNPSTLHPSALEQFEEQAHQKTEAAVAEGHHDIDELKATATGYVEQAKQIAASALSTAQVPIL
ncbi:hypothetical protein H0H81_007437 [Sphagnurus paluster]|uniref:Uncharacterized protein n=1 Tax=Sphagnurus paluster TaxID=117069 RepID=A0A9P7GR58_9AGAR|nr:hypothetical protein H0H81_007437 [Sphagnurus paluster]